ncbi:MAG: type IV secretion system protein [Sporichthyaceae bacterium]|nr:type IV secretion system protein [Sporichthyaceae bacterium]
MITELSATLAARLAALGTVAAQPNPDQPGILEPFTVTDSAGVPISHYDIHADMGAWDDIMREITYWPMSVAFAGARVLVGFAAWLIDWALQFELVRILFRPVDNISTAFQNLIVDRIGLPGLMLSIAGVYATWLVLFRSRSRGMREGAMSILISAIVATWLASPALLLLGEGGTGGVTHAAKCFTAGVAELALPPDTPDPEPGRGPVDPGEFGPCTGTERISEPVTQTLVDTFIRRPHQLLNYGVTFDGSVDGRCRDAYDQIVRDGPWATADEHQDNDPRKIMTSAGCEAYAEFNEDPTIDRLLGSLLTFMAALIIVALFIVVVGGYLLAQLWLAFEVIRAVFVLPFAILPGPGRAALWQWVGGVLRALLTLFLSLVFLALFMTFVQVLLEQTNGQALIVSFVVIDVAAFAALVFHRRLLNAGHRAAATVTAKLAHSRPPSGPPVVWVRTGAPPSAVASFIGQGRGELRTAAKPITAPAALGRQALHGVKEAGGRVRERVPLLRSSGRHGAGGGGGGSAGGALRDPALRGLRAGAALRDGPAPRSGGPAHAANGRTVRRSAAVWASLHAARGRPTRWR